MGEVVSFGKKQKSGNKKKNTVKEEKNGVLNWENTICLFNQLQMVKKSVFDMFMETASEAVKTMGFNPKHFNANYESLRDFVHDSLTAPQG